MRYVPVVLALLVPSLATASPTPTLTLTKITHGDADVPTGFFTRDGKTFYVKLGGQLLRGAPGGDGTTTNVKTDANPDWVVPLGVSPDGTKAAYGELNHIVMLDLTTGATTRQQAWNAGSTHNIEWLTSTKLLATTSGDWDSAVAITDLEAKASQMICTKLKVKSSMDAWAAPDGKHLAVVADGNLVWTDVACKSVKKQPGWKGWVKRVAISPGGKWIAANDDGGAGIGGRVQVGKVGSAPKLVVTGKGRMSGEPFWLSNDLLLFTDGGPFEPSETDQGQGLMLYAVKTGAIQKVTLPEKCEAYVLAVPAGGGHALLEVTCAGKRTIGILSAPAASR